MQRKAIKVIRKTMWTRKRKGKVAKQTNLLLGRNEYCQVTRMKTTLMILLKTLKIKLKAKKDHPQVKRHPRRKAGNFSARKCIG